MEELFVHLGQIAALKTKGILTTVGLGSCVGVTLYDHFVQVGVMGHIFLPQRRPGDNSVLTLPGKYADTGIPAMIREALRLGAQRSRLQAKVAGGANLFPNLQLGPVSIGEQNVVAISKHLQNYKIPLVGQDVLGNHGRKMRFFIKNGVVAVTAIGKRSREI